MTDESFEPEAELLEALAEFAAGAGHEINNPLATIVGRAQQLLRDETDPQKRQMLATIGSQALRVRDMIGDLMFFGRPPEPRIVPTPLRERVERAVAQQQHDLGIAGCEVELRIAPSVTVAADPRQLEMVFAELLRNARQAMLEHGGPILVDAVPDGEDILITFRDSGRGMSDREQAHLFDPCFSGRSAGRGLGYGLCKVWRIVQHHGGEISGRNQKGAGVEFTIRWPHGSDRSDASAGLDGAS